MAHRRFHTKSRHGCVQCKKNRTKCDEQKPKCGRCERIGAECSLAEESSDWFFVPAKPAAESTAAEPANDTKQQPSCSSSKSTATELLDQLQKLSASAAGAVAATQSPLNFEDGLRIADGEMERLRLMHHYTAHTAQTIADVMVRKDSDLTVWATWLPEMAFEHDFLLHGLLGLSALHLALLRAESLSRNKHLVVATHHYDRALTLFRPHVVADAAAVAANFDAIFAFSCVVAFYSFGFHRCSLVSPSPPLLLLPATESPIARLHQVLVLIRRSSAVVKADHEALARSRWSSVMLLYPLSLPEKLPVDMEDMLATLRRRTTTTISAAAQPDLYTMAIQMLRDNLAVAINYPPAQLTITLFPVICPAEFWDMVRIGEPLALAILANYAVILHWQRENIWLQGWGVETVQAVRHSLPPDWHECIAWAALETKGAHLEKVK